VEVWKERDILHCELGGRDSRSDAHFLRFGLSSKVMNMTESPSRTRFDDSVVIVSGAANGIGLGVASAFTLEGAAVYGFDVDLRGLEAASRNLAGAQGRLIPVQTDVSRSEDISRGVQHVLAATGRIDVLVNNAGINMDKRIADLEVADWDKVFDTNLKSMYLLCKAVWPNFVARRSGVIVNLASIMGQRGGISSPAYCSTKAGIIMLSRCLAKDGAAHGIRVNSVCPGYIDTPIMKKVLEAMADPVRARQDLIDQMPLGRMGTPADVAAGILFLASADAAYISGTELTIDGAVTATQID
jgi:NAD(P)-dependent dehydrogenase (short-subunit alcohol dehydrogenase family)